MSHAESQFCSQTRDLFQATLDGRTPFVLMAANLLADLRTVVRKGWDISAASAVAHSLAALDLVSARQKLTPSAAEASFLRDADAFLDFALRNGLTFDTVAAVLTHDFLEIAAHEFKLDVAVAKESFRPQLTGWAKRNQESMVEADEPLD